MKILLSLLLAILLSHKTEAAADIEAGGGGARGDVSDENLNQSKHDE